MTNRIWVPEGLGEVYCDKAYQAFSDDEKEGLVAYERVQTRRERQKLEGGIYPYTADGDTAANSTRTKNHVTTGDVRLDLGWTQEECDEADSRQDHPECDREAMCDICHPEDTVGEVQTLDESLREQINNDLYPDDRGSNQYANPAGEGQYKCSQCGDVMGYQGFEQGGLLYCCSACYDTWREMTPAEQGHADG